jgi:DNA repair exonuclease SbcCD ATPase subunit
VSTQEDNSTEKEAGTNEVSETDQNKLKDDSAKAPESISKEEVSRLLEKARADEKAKLYPELEKSKGVVTSLEEKIAELTKQSEERHKELESLRAGETDKAESINRELRELKEQNTKLSSAIDRVSQEAAERIRKSELASYREKKIRSAGIKHLDDLVVGDSEEDIDKSIEATKKREDDLFVAAREEARKDLAKNLPTPISPEGSKGRGPTVMTPSKKEEYAKLRGADYAKIKSQLLADAKTKAGLT